MLDLTPLRKAAARIPRIFPGAMLHRWGLQALHRGAFDVADYLFERAASRYRSELAVEPLARLRAHQLIARVRSIENPERESRLCLEVERVLARLNRIEALEPPFAMVDARSLLATWIRSTACGRTDEPAAGDAALAA
jgi:hypothetical protein